MVFAPIGAIFLLKFHTVHCTVEIKPKTHLFENRQTYIWRYNLKLIGKTLYSLKKYTVLDNVSLDHFIFLVELFICKIVQPCEPVEAYLSHNSHLAVITCPALKGLSIEIFKQVVFFKKMNEDSSSRCWWSKHFYFAQSFIFNQQVKIYLLQTVLEFSSFP